MEILRETRDLSQAMCISGGFTISIVGSLQFAAVNRHNLLGGIAIHIVAREINYVKLYRGLTVTDFNIFFCFRSLIYLAPVVS